MARPTRAPAPSNPGPRGRKHSGISDKLIAFSTKILVSTMLTLIILGAVLGIIEYRSSSVMFAANLRKNIESKGRLLATNNSIALRGMAEDNSFLSIRELVVATVRDDPDIVYGIFMDTERRPWAIAEKRNALRASAQTRPLEDSMSVWASTLERCSWRGFRDGDREVIEFAAPIIGSDSTRLGILRYGVSVDAVEKTLTASRSGAFLRSLVYPAACLCIGLLLFLLQSRMARREADNITLPLQRLTEATHSIASGNYGMEIRPDTDDEIGMLARSFEKMRVTIKQYTGNLEEMVEERTEQLKAAQKEIIEKAHRAGMADIATGTLHNVGNILNSVRTSIDCIVDQVGTSPLGGLQRANALLREKLDDLSEFFRSDPRSTKLMHYYFKLEEAFSRDHEAIRQSSTRLSEKVNAITEVIAAQQNYAGASGLVEIESPSAAMEDALTMQSGSIERYGITIHRNYAEVPKIPLQKTKLVHVLINLLKNAKEAMQEVPAASRAITITISHDDLFVYIAIGDSGVGISKQDLTRVFNHGFTTKKEGHGFGLHSSANYIKEMGGTLWAESKGPGAGAVFMVKLPKAQSSPT